MTTNEDLELEAAWLAEQLAKDEAKKLQKRLSSALRRDRKPKGMSDLEWAMAKQDQVHERERKRLKLQKKLREEDAKKAARLARYIR